MTDPAPIAPGDPLVEVPPAPAPAPVGPGAPGRGGRWLVAGVLAVVVALAAGYVIAKATGDGSSTAARGPGGGFPGGGFPGGGFPGGGFPGGGFPGGGPGQGGPGPGMPGQGVPGGGTAAPEGGLVQGTIRSIDGDRVVVAGVGGARTEVRVPASASVVRTSIGELGDLHVGDLVQVVGSFQGTTLTAGRVAQVLDDAGAPLVGTIRAIEGATLTIEGPQGPTLAVTTTASTVVVTAERAGREDLVRGAQVVVSGDRSDGIVVADAVRIGPG